MKPNGQTRTAAGIERLLEERIRRGAYAEGQRIPTVRQMAERLRVNKNTVARAYQALARRGYLDLSRGRGAFVRARKPATGALDSRWLTRLDQLLVDAKQQDLSRETVLREITQGVDRLYGSPGLKIVFIECNAPDIEEMGGQVSAAVGHQLEGVLLSDFLKQPQDYARRCDLIVTTFYHLSEVGKALGAERKDKVIGVHAMPSHDALLKIARLHVQAIGLVCDRPGTVDNLTHIIHTYHPTATIMPALVNDKQRLKKALNRADAIIVTRSCHALVSALKPKAPIIMVVFTIDQQSIDFLRTQIEQREMTHAH